MNAASSPGVVTRPQGSAPRFAQKPSHSGARFRLSPSEAAHGGEPRRAMVPPARPPSTHAEQASAKTVLLEAQPGATLRPSPPRCSAGANDVPASASDAAHLEAAAEATLNLLRDAPTVRFRDS